MFVFFLFFFFFKVYVSTLPLSPDTPEEGIRSHHIWLWATMWLLGSEPRTSGRAVSAPNRWAISPAPVFIFFKHSSNSCKWKPLGGGVLWASYYPLFTGWVKSKYPGAGEMAQQSRALSTLPKVLSSNPSNHMVAHNHPQWDLMPSSGVSEDSDSALTYNK